MDTREELIIRGKEAIRKNRLGGFSNGSEILRALESAQTARRYSKIEDFLESLSDVEFYRYRKLLLETFYTSKFTPSPANAGTQEFIAKSIGESPSNVNNIEAFFKSFLSRSGFPNTDFLRKGGSPDISFRNLLLSIGGSNNTKLLISISKGKSILSSFITLLINEGGLAELNFQGSNSFGSLFDELHKKFKLRTQSNGHRQRAERLKKMGPMLKVINSNVKLLAIFKKSDTDKHASSYKKKDPLSTDGDGGELESRLSDNDEKTYKQLTSFFVKLGSDTSLMRLFYECAMIIAKRESKLRRKKLKEANEKGPIKLEGLRIGLGITGGIYSEVESMLYPNRSKGILTVGKEDYFGGSFNLGGYLTEAFRVNSRNRAEKASDIPWPTYDGPINFAGPLSMFDETHLSADDYSRDYHRGFEIFGKHFFHSNHLFNCDVVSQEKTKEGTLSLLRDTETNEVVRVLTDDIVRTAGGGEHRVGSKDMNKESFQIIKDSEEKFNPEIIYQDVVNWMASPEYKQKTANSKKIPFRTKFPNTPIRLTSQQFIILSKQPGFPFEVFVEGLDIAWIGDGDSTKIGLERVYLNKAKGTISEGYTEPTSFVVGKDIDYKQKFKKGQRARYGRIANYIASEDENTTNYRILPLQGTVMKFDARGAFRYLGVESGSIVVDLKPDFKISGQLRSKLNYTLNTDSTAVFDYDLIVDCSGYDGSALGNIIKTQEVDLGKTRLSGVPAPVEEAALAASARDSLDRNIQENPKFSYRFIMRNGSWFEIKFSDKHRVVVGAYNEGRKLYKEFLFFRDDFEEIFQVGAKFDRNSSSDENIKLTVLDTKEIYSLIDFLGYDSKFNPTSLFPYIEDIKTYLNILDPGSGQIEDQVYIKGDNLVNDSLIDSVFRDVSKRGIRLFTKIGRSSGFGSGIRFLGPMGKILTPRFSDFENDLLNDQLGIGENVVARFRVRWRVYCELYGDFNKRVERDERCSTFGADGGDEITVTNKDMFYEGREPLPQRFSRQILSFDNTQEKQNLVRKKYGDKNYIDRNLYFRSWIGDMLNELTVDAGYFELSGAEKAVVTIPLSMTKTKVETSKEKFKNSYRFDIGKNNPATDLDKYFQGIFYRNQEFQKQICEYISYVVQEYGTSTLKSTTEEKKELALRIPLRVVNGKIVLDTGGLDRGDYNARMDAAYASIGEQELNKENGIEDTASTTASGIADTLGAASKPLKYQRAQFGFYDPDGCELKI